ncbi:hypothetical protein J2X69_003987 [Algoriphagus sp. 4150]|uniref:hypothetical protein n=1 Tax=Algoriphagus sp. 4150 TaxID=2817756 RepID=UPI0028644D94|nr:hypothetical protein [Algoriphagus sp. 4150]MDR7131623.1 hypothetical protein [Algoriphagus sp. 4150]
MKKNLLLLPVSGVFSSVHFAHSPYYPCAKIYQANGHLKNIPTEKEGLGNGENLFEMTVKLPGKVKELTASAVQQKEHIKILKARLEIQP